MSFSSPETCNDPVAIGHWYQWGGHYSEWEPKSKMMFKGPAQLMTVYKK